MALVALVLLQQLPSLARRQCPLHCRAAPAAHVIPVRQHQTPTVPVLHRPTAGTVKLHPFQVQAVHGVYGSWAVAQLGWKQLDFGLFEPPSKTPNAKMVPQRSPK